MISKILILLPDPNNSIVVQSWGIPRKELWTEIDVNSSGSIEFNELVK